MFASCSPSATINRLSASLIQRILRQGTPARIAAIGLGDETNLRAATQLDYVTAKEKIIHKHFSVQTALVLRSILGGEGQDVVRTPGFEFGEVEAEVDFQRRGGALAEEAGKGGFQVN